MQSLKGSISHTTQQVNGLRVTNSAYGQAIPLAYGHCRVNHRLINWYNFQTQNSGGGKKGGGKKGGGMQPSYTVSADMLLGYGKFEGIGAIWNGQTWYYVNFGSQTFTGVGPGTLFNFTVSNNPAQLIMIMGVAYQFNYTANFTDYVFPGLTRSYSLSGATIQPLYNDQFEAPNGGRWRYAAQPYATYNATYGNATVAVNFPISVSNVTIIVYYAYLGGSNSTGTSSQSKKGAGGSLPIQQPGLVFAPVVASGGSGEFSGVHGDNIPLGPSPVLPQFNYEVKSMFGLGNAAPATTYSSGGYVAQVTSGDCNPADIIADLICSGNHVPFFGNTAVWNHGLNFSSLLLTAFADVRAQYSRYGGILKDEPNCWGPSFNGGSNLGLNDIRNYCLAYGIFISGSMDSQRSAASWLDDLCLIANCAPVFDGASLRLVPYAEVSAYGNGASYVPLTAAGPLFDLTSDDFLPNDAGSPVTLEYSRPSQNFNSVTIQFEDRRGQFNSNSATVSDSDDITLQGPMPGSSKSLMWIKDVETATSVAWSMLRRQLLTQRKTYRFKLPAFWSVLLTQMDLVTLEEPTLSTSPIPVRLTRISEQTDESIACEAEPFIYGACVPNLPSQFGTPTSTGNGGNGNADPGSVNTPIIFEAVPKLASKPQVWFCVSGSNPNYGGCVAWMSTDGGGTYNQIGIITGKQNMGVVYNSNYPLGTDPDNADTLFVDLTESTGTLQSWTSSQQNAFVSLCYLAGGGTILGANGVLLTIPYELVALGATTLTASNKYSCAPPIRRGAYNTPPAVHNIGTLFSYLEDGRVFTLDLTKAMTGVALHFKFTAFNLLGQNQQNLSAATDYIFTPTGQVGWGQQGYSIAPQPTVYQGQSGGWAGIDGSSSTWTAPQDVYFPPVTATFTDGTITKYAARDAGIAVFTVAGGGETAWVTIYDPSLSGEPSGVASLPTYVDLNQTRWNTPGYIRIGTLTSNAFSGGGGSGGGGGTGNGGADDIWIDVPTAAGTYAANQELFYSKPPRQVTLPISLTGTNAGCRVAPTGSVAVTILKNGVSVGTVNIAAGATTATFTFASAIGFNGTGDSFSVKAPASPDATFAGFFMNIWATRSN